MDQRPTFSFYVVYFSSPNMTLNLSRNWLQLIAFTFFCLGLCLIVCIWWLQTYVLDVHPFNPRIAMSAGYDGKTIVWDVSPLLLVFFLFTHSKFFCTYVSSLVPKLHKIVQFLDMGRCTYSDIWNWTIQASWWKVFSVSQWSCSSYIFSLYI